MAHLATSPVIQPYDDTPIPYIDRTRAYYLALGYERPYQWARHVEVPFQRIVKPLSDARIALVTTAAPYKRMAGDQGPWSAYNAAAKFHRVYQVPVDPEPDLRISHVAIDRHHTSQADRQTWFPLRQLRRAEQEGRIGAVVRHVYGLPTNRSQRVTAGQDAPDLLDRLKLAEADRAILVPNCPVCHQSVALAARHLEANGIATVIVGCASDIVERCGVPRFLFSDFPLGNSAGRPHDADSQRITLDMALDLLEDACAPRTTLRSPLRWSEDSDWKLDYANPDLLTEEDLAERRRDFDRQKMIARMVAGQA